MFIHDISGGHEFETTLNMLIERKGVDGIIAIALLIMLIVMFLDSLSLFM